jgi:hypothetical protein
MCDEYISYVEFDEWNASTMHMRAMNAAYTFYDSINSCWNAWLVERQFSAARKHKQAINYYDNNAAKQFALTLRTNVYQRYSV